MMESAIGRLEQHPEDVSINNTSTVITNDILLFSSKCTKSDLFSQCLYLYHMSTNKPAPPSAFISATGSTFCDISDIKLFSLELYHHYLISSNIFNFSQKVLRSYLIINYLKCISASDHDNFNCSQYSMLSGVPCVFAWMKDIFRYSVEIKFLPKNYCTFYGICKSDILDVIMFKETGISYRESIINCALIRSPKPLHFDLMESFINDSFVQYPNNPDDHSFSSSARLASEEAILRCEEERFELDIVIETAKFTIGYFQKYILDSYSSFPLNLTYTSANFHSVIRSTLIRLYGERFEEIYYAILFSPIVVIPVILDRLNEKILEWKNAKKHFNRIWRQNTSKYFNKVLPMLSFSNYERALYSIDSSWEFKVSFEYYTSQGNSQSQTQPYYLLIDSSCLFDINSLLVNLMQRHRCFGPHDQSAMLIFLERFFSRTDNSNCSYSEIQTVSFTSPNGFTFALPDFFYCNWTWVVFLKSYTKLIHLISQLKTTIFHIYCSQLDTQDFEQCFNSYSHQVLSSTKILYTKLLNLISEYINSYCDGLILEELSRGTAGICQHYLVSIQRLIPVLKEQLAALSQDFSFRLLIPYFHFYDICHWIDLRIVYTEALKILSFDTIYRVLYQPITSNLQFELYDQLLSNTNFDIIEGDSGNSRNVSVRCRMNNVSLCRIIRKSIMKSSHLRNTHPDLFIKFQKWVCDPFCSSISCENFYLSWRFFISDLRNMILSTHRANRFHILILKSK